MTETDTPTSTSWHRKIGVLIGAFLIFGFGWSQGELNATQRLAEALQHVAPATITTVREACPRELSDPGWTESCFDLLPLTYFFDGAKK